MTEKIGIIAFSFALTQDEVDKKLPNQCNKTLARITRVLAQNIMETRNVPVVVLQWEIGLDHDMFARIGVLPDLVVEKHQKFGKYLDSEEIIAQATHLFKEHGVTKVISVAQWLQNFKCRALLKKAGFEVLPVKIGKIGFCKESLQWWTRGPIRLVLYTIKQILFGHHGR